MKLYHIDRLGTLKDGQKIELQSLENLTEEVQKSYFARDFQNGVSKHGQSYLSTEHKPNPLWWTPDGTPLIPACEFENVKNTLMPKSLNWFRNWFGDVIFRRCLPG